MDRRGAVLVMGVTAVAWQLAGCGGHGVAPGADAGTASPAIGGQRDLGGSPGDAAAASFVSCFGEPPAFPLSSSGAGASAATPRSVEARSAALSPPMPSPWGDPRLLSPSQLAVRLAAFLWATEPDAELVNKISACTNLTSEDLRVLVQQMLADGRAVNGLGAFFTWWLRLDRLAQIDRDPTLFPELTPALRLSLAEEPRRFGVDVIQHGDGTFRSLFTAPYTFMDGNLAVLYGHTAIPASAPFQKVDLPPSMLRAGLLTQPGLLATAAAPDRNSPSLRAVDLNERLVCLDTPAAGQSPSVHYDANDLRPVLGRTLRQAIESTLSDPVCASCHSVLEIGFAFEAYDPLGRVRVTDNGVLIDPSAPWNGDTASVSGAVDLGAQASALPEVGRCFVRKWLRFALGRELTDPEAALSVDPLFNDFHARDFDIRALIGRITQTALFLAP